MKGDCATNAGCVMVAVSDACLVLVLQAQEGPGAGKGLYVSCTQRKMVVLQVHLRNAYDIL
jgi:hypothetical protein